MTWYTEKTEKIKRIFSDYEIIVHTNAENGYHLGDDDIEIEIKNPYSKSSLSIVTESERIEIDNVEFTVYFGDWHGHYNQSAYEEMIEDLLAIIENRYCSVVFMRGDKRGCSGLLSEKITPQTPFESIVLKMVSDERNIPLFKSQYTAVNVQFWKLEDCFKIEL